MSFMVLFHELVVPIVGGIVLTLVKLIANQKLISFDESNDIALDLVLVGVGALGALYIKSGAVQVTIDAGLGDALFAAILLYVRFRRTRLGISSGGTLPTVGPISGIAQLIMGALAIIWTIKAF
ncbi:MAG: hypothetical protein ABSF53_09610 [Terracidiphilus sp.]|jgi:hypothetical protein